MNSTDTRNNILKQAPDLAGPLSTHEKYIAAETLYKAAVYLHEHSVNGEVYIEDQEPIPAQTYLVQLGDAYLDAR